ncbi:MAG: hypothetical protein LBL66_10010 [Clostridiales bacterium]|nr:hypothetical protein [Clostridiales bacterium]
MNFRGFQTFLTRKKANAVAAPWRDVYTNNVATRSLDLQRNEYGVITRSAEARRGNRYKTRNAPFYTEIGNNGRLLRGQKPYSIPKAPFATGQQLIIYH